MTEGLQALGAKLRSRREEMNLSLKEVECATSIRIAYLMAIEEGKIDHCLAPAYALGFLRQYGGFLGFESQQLAQEYPEAFRFPNEKQDFAYGIGTMEARHIPQKARRWMPAATWAAGGMALFAFIWIAVKFLGLM